MRTNRTLLAAGVLLGATFLLATPSGALAQGLQKKDTAPVRVSASLVLTPEIQTRIRAFYTDRGVTGAEALPPGIRKRLARGKPLPPGIAKRPLPAGLRSHIGVPRGYDLVEVGLDVLVVEVGTAIVREVLKDVVR